MYDLWDYHQQFPFSNGFKKMEWSQRFIFKNTPLLLKFYLTQRTKTNFRETQILDHITIPYTASLSQLVLPTLDRKTTYILYHQELTGFLLPTDVSSSSAPSMPMHFCKQQGSSTEAIVSVHMR
jgi:hypothetical protein